MKSDAVAYSIIIIVRRQVEGREKSSPRGRRQNDQWILLVTGGTSAWSDKRRGSETGGEGEESQGTDKMHSPLKINDKSYSLQADSESAIIVSHSYLTVKADT